MRAFAGTAYIKVDGEQMAVTSDAITVPFNTVTRETIVGATGVIGFSERERVPFVAGTFYVTKDFPMEKILTNTAMTVTVEFKTGKTFVLTDAAVVQDSEYDGVAGTVSLRFEGTNGDWM